jgi:hypothetical protein
VDAVEPNWIVHADAIPIETHSTLSTGPYSTIDTSAATSYVNRVGSGKTYYYLTIAVNVAGRAPVPITPGRSQSRSFPLYLGGA